MLVKVINTPEIKKHTAPYLTYHTIPELQVEKLKKKKGGLRYLKRITQMVEVR